MTYEERDMSEEDRAVQLLRTMPDEPPSPSTIDIPRTMAEGRRRRRARRWSGGVALAAVTAVAAGGGTVAVAALREPAPPTPAPSPTASTVAAAPAPAAAVPVPKDCTVTLLPSGDIRKALVTSGDPSGRYLAGRVYPPSGVHTVLWKDGVLQPRPPMPGADASWEDINSSGVAVGSSYSGEVQYAYVSPGKSVTRLHGGEASAAAINDAGVIAGALGKPYEGVPAMWPSASAAPVELPLPAGYTAGAAEAIGEDGTIVGTVEKKATEGTGYLWLPGGATRLMPMPTVEGKRATLFWPDSLSNGWVYGRAVLDLQEDGSRRFTSYRYNIATNKYEKLATPLGPPAIGAENGWILGTTGRYEPVLLAGKKVVQLPRYATMKEYQVTALSADGKTAAGYTTDTDDTEGVANRPLRWTCR
ncbi:hypothetical protein Ade02nite_46880 [Paractinoplanes deccanensis]|uniref:Uncharacterized protein n=2 Tax=Paractinoplanes deccanensis TaxID=113561 RepID=A0ABQ3Y7S1_9ACTN|nr:hypothetical protein Ade02nite_46880 [Actinoplanes deccanensis]